MPLLRMDAPEKPPMAGRQPWIDIFKGISILLVVLGHMSIPQKLYTWIYLFHMYAFFFIAGVTYHYRETRSWWQYFCGSVRRLYVPYLCYGTVWNLILIIRGVQSGAIALSGRYLIADALSVLLGGKLFYWVESSGPVWFLCALLFVRVTFDGIAKSTKNNYLLLFLFSIATFFLAWVNRGRSYFFLRPFRIGQSLSGFIFFFFCYVISRYLPQIHSCFAVSQGRWRGIAGCGICGLILCWMTALSEKPLVLAQDSIPERWYVILAGGIAGCILVMLVSMLLESLPGLSQLLSYYGKNSMVVMGTHREIRLLVLSVLEQVAPLCAAWGITAIAFFLIMLLSIPVIQILSSYCPVIVGGGSRKQ